MKDKVLHFIKSNSALKALSLLLAFIIWFVIVSETNPLEQTDLRVAYILGVEDQQVETSGGITLKNITSVDTRVEVTVKGRQESLTNVSSEDVTISLNLSDVKSSGVQDVPVEVKSNKIGVNIVDYSPKVISINFEKIIEATFPVTVKVEDGVLQEGFVVAATSVNPETIQLRGFESVISKISTVQVVVADVDAQIDHSKSFRMICKYYDASGNEVTDLDGIETVDVSIIAGRPISLNYNITGTPAEDCYIEEISITPKNVVVVGPSTTLIDIVSLDTTEIDLDGMTEDLTQVVDVVLPYGVTLADPSIRPTVTIKLGGIIEKQFSINNDNITLSGMAEQYVYTLNSVSALTLKGKDTVLDAMEASSLKGRANVSGLGIGTHEVLVSVTGLASGLTIPSGGYAKVSVTIRAATVETPEPSESTGPTDAPESSAPTETPAEPTPEVVAEIDA